MGSVERFSRSTVGGCKGSQVAKFNDVFFLKKSTQIGWIVGSKSMILHTADGGKSWERQPSMPFPASFDNGTVLKTTDGGKTWNKTNTSTFTVLGAITFVDETHGWAGGDGGFVTHTNNGGRTWSAQDTKTNNEIKGIDF